MQVHADYEEQVMLRDGTRGVLRAVHPADAPLLAEGMHHLSESSRYMRFMTPKEDLTADELEQLSHPDFVDHVALGIIASSGALDGEPLGVGRFYRIAPDRAEMAVTVVDEAQGKGVGSVIADRLVVAALERGITVFEALVLAQNQRMLHLLRHIDPDAELEVDTPGVFRVVTQLPTAS